MKQEVNLFLMLPVQPRWRLSAETIAQLWGGVLLLLLLVYVFTYWWTTAANSKLVALHKQKDVAESAYNKLVQMYPKTAAGGSGLEKRVQALAQETRAKAAMVDILKKQGSLNTKGFSEYLVGFATQVIPGTWLQNINIEMMGAGTIILMGEGLNTQGVLNFAKQLQRAKAFNGMSFKVSNIRKKDEKSEGVVFTITGISEKNDG